MSVLSLSGISKYYGDRPVFTGVTFSLSQGDRAGLVGRNGSGKTTLLRIIAGSDPGFQGSVHLASGAEVGFLRQDLDLEGGRTLWDLARGAFPRVISLARELEELEQRMSRDPSSEALLARYGRLRDQFELAGGYEWETRIATVLGGLGFSKREWSQDVGDLSGGERIRAHLARLLLEEPDLLLLDEPTNHLDWEALGWLEGFLVRYGGSVVVVSHDRYFLDRVATSVLALEMGTVTHYRGNYSAFRDQREQARERADKRAREIREEKEKLKAYIRRYKAGNRSTQAKSREKRLERLRELEKEEITPRDEPSRSHIRLYAGSRSGEEVLHLEGVGHGFDDEPLFSGLSGLIRRGERLGVVGPNGAGKSTLLKIMAERVRPREGRVRLGTGVRPAYLDQNLGLSHEDRALWEEMNQSFGWSISEAREQLATMGFIGDDYQKRIRDLSGGERTRLILGKIRLAEPNLLLLDEPTNHLDIEARQVLEDNLETFGGTVVVVTHDRALLDRLATRLLVFGARGAEWFEGSFSQWRQSQEEEGPQAEGETGAGQPRAADRSPSSGRRQKRASEPSRDPEAIEADINRLTAAREDLETQMADPETYRQGRGQEVVSRHRQLEEQLGELYREWERALEDK